MVHSINTNPSAALGLRTLNQSSNRLNSTQNRIATGKKVSSPKVNAAALAVAQQLIGNIGGLNAAKSSLNRTSSVLDIALNAGEIASNLLIDLRELAVRASDTGLDDASRAALNQEFSGILDTFGSVVSSASFNGTNLLEGDDVSAIINSDGSETISLSGQDITLGSSLVPLSQADDISTSGNASATLALVDAAFANLGQTLTVVGAVSRQVDDQNVFVTRLSDAIEEGVGNLVDANLAEESANLVADQVRQQLGLKAQAIANRAPAAILALF